MNTPDLLYEDEWVLAVDKPPGLRTIPDGYNPSLPHLVGLLKEAYGPIWVVHRLDKDTSGVILFARAPAAHRDLCVQFEQRQTQKTYHALVVGAPDWEDREINLPLRVNGDRRHRTVIDTVKGRPASTTCRVLRRFAGFHPAVTLLEAHPHSGYTHQIRSHLAAQGLPLLGDPLYKSLHPARQLTPAPVLPIQRTALHALQVAFRHPQTGSTLTIQAPYPEDFRQTIHFLSA